MTVRLREALRLNVLGLPAEFQQLMRALVEAQDVNSLTALSVLLFQALRGFEKESKSTNVHSLIDALQHTMKFMWNTDQVQLWVADERSRTATSGTEMWTRGVGKMVVRASVDDGLVGAAFKSGEAISIDDRATADPRFSASVDAVGGGKARVFMAAPLPNPMGGVSQSTFAIF